MTAPRWPDVYAALLVLLPTLPEFSGVPVYDGQPITTDAPTRYVTVGFVTDDGAGSFTQQRDPSGRATVETGAIRCLFAAWSGDTDPAPLRTQVFALVGALQGALEVTPPFGGVLGADAAAWLSVEVSSPENSDGAAVDLLVTVEYLTRTFF